MSLSTESLDAKIATARATYLALENEKRAMTDAIIERKLRAEIAEIVVKNAKFSGLGDERWIILGDMQTTGTQLSSFTNIELIRRLELDLKIQIRRAMIRWNPVVATKRSHRSRTRKLAESKKCEFDSIEVLGCIRTEWNVDTPREPLHEFANLDYFIPTLQLLDQRVSVKAIKENAWAFRSQPPGYSLCANAFILTPQTCERLVGSGIGVLGAMAHSS